MLPCTVQRADGGDWEEGQGLEGLSVCFRRSQDPRKEHKVASGKGNTQEEGRREVRIWTEGEEPFGELLVAGFGREVACNGCPG